MSTQVKMIMQAMKTKMATPRSRTWRGGVVVGGIMNV